MMPEAIALDPQAPLTCKLCGHRGKDVAYAYIEGQGATAVCLAKRDCLERQARVRRQPRDGDNRTSG
ncbi:MAG: hypothetical protein HYX92_14820 [Chloroflexi bacterium]|nr:hypothetical protein [Chloroflexota bacterium]